LRAWSARHGLVDQPHGRRKMHANAIPVAGGVAILLSTVAALAAAAAVPGPFRDHLDEQGYNLLGLLLAAVIICAVGVADDLGCLRGRHKLFGQLLAVALVTSFGLVVRRIHLFHWQVELGLLAVPFTIFWLLGAINAFNLIDGMDGLLTSVAIIFSLAMTAMALMGGQWITACVAAALAGALLGFLRYNFPPATVFLGDSGSMLIGLVVAVLAIHSALKGPATIVLPAPIAVLTIPIFDTMAAITRRKLTGRSLYTSDRGHLHHCLLRQGLSCRHVLYCVSCFCLLTAAGALTTLALNNELFAIFAVVLVVGLLIATRLFGYAEFLLIKDCLASAVASFFSARAPSRAHQTEIRLQGTANWKQLWSKLTECADRLKLESVRLDVNAPAIHEGYHARWQRPDLDLESPGLWRAEIPVLVQGQTVGRLEIIGERDLEPLWMKIATLDQLTGTLEGTFPAVPKK